MPRNIVQGKRLNRPAQVLSAITTLNVICFVLVPALAVSAIHQFSLYGIEVAILLVVLMLVFLVFARAVPKGIAIHRPENVAFRWGKFVNTEISLSCRWCLLQRDGEFRLAALRLTRLAC